MSTVKPILQLEGAAVFASSVWLYFFEVEGSWVLFLLLLLAPDISMVGFLKDAKLGGITYDLAHNYIIAAAVIVGGAVADKDVITSLGLILSAHVGMDRSLTYGLKYPTHFKHTHMQRI